MNCDELEQLQGPCLDSELDAKTDLEIKRHLAACPDCARMFAEEEKLEARIMAGLNQGQRTAALWQQIERSVAAAGLTVCRPQLSTGTSRPGGWRTVFAMLGRQIRAGLLPSPGAWAGLAAVWAVILGLNLTARESASPSVAGRQVPSASEVRFALAQKQLLMAELAFMSEPVPAVKPKAAPPSPRSDRRSETLSA